MLVEGFRPGVTERLGLGPDACSARNPRLVYARMTGWGQDGPLAARAGHDLNYLALTGALAAVGPAGGDPVPPLNLVGDYGGGSMLLLVGVLAALVERASSGRGQVVDAAMVDGVSSLLALTHGLLAAGWWREERGANLLDGGAPYYRTYRCADGGYVAVAALEDRFWAELVRVLDLDLTGVADRNRPASWPLLQSRLSHAFATRPRADWAAAFEGVDACVTPVLTFTESATHPQVGGRGAVTTSGRALAPGAAPRFSRTPGQAGDAARPPAPTPARRCSTGACRRATSTNCWPPASPSSPDSRVAAPAPALCRGARAGRRRSGWSGGEPVRPSRPRTRARRGGEESWFGGGGEGDMLEVRYD